MRLSRILALVSFSLFLLSALYYSIFGVVIVILGGGLFLFSSWLFNKEADWILKYELASWKENVVLRIHIIPTFISIVIFALLIAVSWNGRDFARLLVLLIAIAFSLISSIV